MGVWIETAIQRSFEEEDKSHPSWVCGLKQLFLKRLRKHILSHPSWVCGLKLKDSRGYPYQVRHTLRGCVD